MVTDFMRRHAVRAEGSRHTPCAAGVANCSPSWPPTRRASRPRHTECACYFTAATLRQHRAAHQIAVDLAGGFATFVDGPDYQGLAAAAVAGGEDLRDARGVTPI